VGKLRLSAKDVAHNGITIDTAGNSLSNTTILEQGIEQIHSQMSKVGAVTHVDLDTRGLLERLDADWVEVSINRDIDGAFPKLALSCTAVRTDLDPYLADRRLSLIVIRECAKPDFLIVYVVFE
jgi:hypothetical protein